jgi:hypothetical protein
MGPLWRVVARLTVLLALPAGASARGVQTPAEPASPVITEFRVFDGISEVSAAARLRVRPAGVPDEARDVVGQRIDLAPAMYDVQALHERVGGVVAIKWAERLAVMHYPDEGGRHLEVINMQSGFGALQLRATEGPLTPDEVTLFPAGEADTPMGQAVAGDGYVLFVVPAGRYDVRVEHAEHGGSADTHWLIDVQVPADRTRLKLVEPSGR